MVPKCITKEDELMYELLSRRCETSETVKLCYTKGIAKETELILDMLKRNHPDAYCEYLLSNTLRRFAATALAKLELELAGRTAGTDGDGTHKGDSTVGDLNREGSDSVGNSKEDMSQH
ncbi:hypothetical protein EJB05_36677, partial [Eragrostis curvula]